MLDWTCLPAFMSHLFNKTDFNIFQTFVDMEGSGFPDLESVRVRRTNYFPTSNKLCCRHHLFCCNKDVFVFSMVGTTWPTRSTWSPWSSWSLYSRNRIKFWGSRTTRKGWGARSTCRCQCICLSALFRIQVITAQFNQMNIFL